MRWIIFGPANNDGMSLREREASGRNVLFIATYNWPSGRYLQLAQWPLGMPSTDWQSTNKRQVHVLLGVPVGLQITIHRLCHMLRTHNALPFHHTSAHKHIKKHQVLCFMILVLPQNQKNPRAHNMWYTPTHTVFRKDTFKSCWTCTNTQ